MKVCDVIKNYPFKMFVFYCTIIFIFMNFSTIKSYLIKGSELNNLNSSCKGYELFVALING